ncbi:MAG: hypothetical protein QM741_08630 [Rudaea sp.]|uniref:hypothetical protein n=1 Tax=Rudaea sp. TaxID=2136325 RepID=UPI0039E5A202
MKTLLSSLVLAALSCAPLARAGDLVDLSVIDRDTGKTLTTYARDGKIYVAGTPGHRYSVRIANRIGERVLAVLSVDGVNAVTGQTASPAQSGYVLDPYQNTDVAGWRKSASEVAQFNFTALSSSYAAKTGRPDNVGAIGVAVFREKPLDLPWREGKIASAPLADRYTPPSPPAQPASQKPAPASVPSGAMDAESAIAKSAGATNDLARAETAAPGSAAHMRKAEESLGTGHGAREISHVAWTEFARAGTQPNEVVSIRYDSRANLVALGVIPPPPPPRRFVEPQAFPGGFVPDPRS